MKMKKGLAIIIAAILTLSLLAACGTPSSSTAPADSTAESTTNDAATSTESTADSGRQLVIGVSQPHSTSAWRILQTDSVNFALEAAGYKVIYTDAQNNTQKQVADVEDILAQNPDYLVISPREEDGLVPAIEAAKAAGVPVILLDRKVKGEAGVDYVTYVGSDYVAAGEAVANWLNEEFDGVCNIVEIAGTAGSTAAIERSQGFRQGIEGKDGLVLLASQVGDMKRVEAQKAMENMIQAHGESIDAVFCQSDEMAYGAVQALNIHGIDPGSIKICTMDGLQETLETIVAGDIAMSMYNNPDFGPYVVDIIQRLEAGETLDTWIKVENMVFDSANAQQYLEEIYGVTP